MAKVYVVTEDYYSDYRITSIHALEETAKEIVAGLHEETKARLRKYAETDKHNKEYWERILGDETKLADHLKGVACVEEWELE